MTTRTALLFGERLTLAQVVELTGAAQAVVEAAWGDVAALERLFAPRAKERQKACAGYEGFKCEEAVPSAAMQTARVKRRAGTPWRCRTCVHRQRSGVVGSRVVTCAGHDAYVCNKQARTDALSKSKEARRNAPWRCRKCAAVVSAKKHKTTRAERLRAINSDPATRKKSLVSFLQKPKGWRRHVKKSEDELQKSAERMRAWRLTEELPKRGVREEMRKTILKLREKGLPYAEIATLLRTSYTRVYNLAKAESLETNPDH